MHSSDSSDCPSREELSAYLVGRLSEQALEAVADHVEGCAACQTLLPSLTDDTDSLIPQLRHSGDVYQVDSPELQGLLEQVKSMTLRPEAVRTEENDFKLLEIAQESPTALGQLGQYRLLGELSHGGMGKVYRAMHEKLEMLVAVKTVRRELVNNPTVIARFQREIKAIGKVRHPNIVRATDAGEFGGVLYLVMELIDGIDLGKLARRLGHGLPLADACEQVRQASLGLQHAHEHGLVHRDIKPSNLILGRDGVVRVLDLGLVRLADPTVGDLTPGDQLMGTCDYIAPEQAKDARSAEIRADIYSLGCTLYYLLTGQPPYSGSSYETSVAKICGHLQDPFPPLQRERPDIPDGFVAVLNRMVAKAPAERYATPAEVAEALTPWTAGCKLGELLKAAKLVPSAGEAGDQSPSTTDLRKAPTQTTPSVVPESKPEAPQPRWRNWLVLGLRLKRFRIRLVITTALLLLVLLLVAIYQIGSNANSTFNKVGSSLGSTSTARTPVPERNGQLAQQAHELLKNHCYRCHGVEFKVPGFNVLDRSSLLAARGKDKPAYLVAGNPEKSLLWQRVGIEGDMPPSGTPPTEAEKQLLKHWIEAGAPFPVRPSRPFVGERDILASIQKHLQQTPPADRKFQRYFTLTHLFNNPRITADELRLQRAALAKLVNSLSWKSTIVVPKAIDPEETVYAIDLQQLGWDQHDLWKEILKAYPYGLTQSQSSDEKLRALAQDVYNLADSELPYLRADWLIATASRPPLYHALLRLLPQARELEQMLKVDVEQDFLRNRLARGGLLTSGVSRQNRLLDRHDAVYGAYWKSYDFKSNDGTGNLVKYPLGPIFADNPFPQQAFEHAGGEIIFNLPNGLQGYLLVDEKDRRIDAGPIDVVSDDLKTSSTPVIVNGLSCMACHKHGVIRFTDKLRAGTNLAGDALAKVQQLFRKKEEMDKLLEKDEKRFLQALEEAAGQFLQIGDDRARNIRDFAEPIGASARLHGKDLGLEEVAFELGIDEPKKLQEMIRRNRELQKLGLTPLLNGGTIKRANWSSQEFATSLFQTVAGELGLGTPYLPL